MDDIRVAAWVEGYLRAWDSNDPAEIAALFREDAAYFTEPYATPKQGRAAIVADWLARRDEPGQTSFRWWPLVVTGQLAVVQGETTDHDQPPRTYSNLWVVRLAGDGRCNRFTEWWMEQPARGGGGAGA